MSFVHPTGEVYEPENPAFKTVNVGAPLPAGTVKLNTAAELVPLFVTLALVPGSPVVVVPTATVAAVPVAPVDPVRPAGIEKLNTAADDVPPLTTVALLPGAPVATEPTAIVAAVPVLP
jgi:hypothetical protein